VWAIHRHMGMGGDQLVESLAGEDVEGEKGDDIRAAEKPLYLELIDEVEVCEGAHELIDELKDRGHRVVLATSAKKSELDHYLDLLDARDRVDGWTSSGDVDATKPEPDLVEAALEKAGGEAVMVGDSTWDCEAARRVEVPVIGVLTGGFAEQELRDRGAEVVFPSLTALRERLDETPLAS
jgi:HAD superfamily hydrolase (TIGR01549 family)